MIVCRCHGKEIQVLADYYICTVTQTPCSTKASLSFPEDVNSRNSGYDQEQEAPI